MKIFYFFYTKHTILVRVLWLSVILIAMIVVRGEAATYYSKASGPANQKSNWGLSKDGTGTAPTYFDISGDQFILSSTSTLDLNGNWTIGTGVTLQIEGSIYVASNDNDITINGTVIFTKTNENQLALAGSGDHFTLGASATLKTANQYGIRGLNCSLPTNASGTITLSLTANYEFNGASQAMTGLPAMINNLTLSGSGTKTAIRNISVTSKLTVNSAVTLNLGTYQLLGTLTSIANIGTIQTQYTSSAPIPTDKTWGGTVQYNAMDLQTVSLGTYNNLTLSGSKNKSITNITTINGNLILNGTATATTSISITYPLTIGGNLEVGFGTTFTTNTTNTTNIKGATSVSGTLILNNTGTKTFTGNVTIKNGGNWSEIGIATINYAGDLQNDGTYSSKSGIHTFSGNGSTIKGTNPIAIAYLTINKTTTNTSALTVSSTLAGVGTLTNIGTLYFSGVNPITSKLTATALGNTINYNSTGGQTIMPTTYNNLTLSGSGSKTLATTSTVNGILSMEGTATASAVPTYGKSATLQYNTASLRTVGFEWITPFSATGGVIIANSGLITLNGAKTLNANVPLIINSGAALDASTYSNTFSPTSNITINGTYQTANSAGFSGATGSAISSTNNPKLSLGSSSSIEYNSIGVQTVSAGTYNNLTTSGTGTKTIPAGSNVTVNGNLITNDLLTIDSDASNSGSLIVNGLSTGTVTYNRWLDHTNTSDPITSPGYSRWYITSAPVNVITGFNNTTNAGKIHVDTTVTPNLYDFATYSESVNEWLYSYQSSSATNLPGSLTPGKGYLISLNPSSDGLIQFTGTLNNGNVTPSVTTSANNGWNAVGNPYTSAIGITGSATSTENFLSKNSSILNPSFAAIYVWNEDATYTGTQQFYKVIGNSGYIPIGGAFTQLPDNYVQAGQGFLIHSNGASSTVTFTKAMQVHQPTVTLKSAEVSWPGLTLLAESHGQTRSAVIAFNELMTTDLNVTYDAGLLASDNFQLYTHLVGGGNEVDFAIQCLPDNLYTELTIPVGVNLPEGGDLVFKASGIILPEGFYPIIEDRLLNVKTLLTKESDSYTVTLDKNTTGIGRFYLSFGDVTSVKPTVLLEKKYTASLVNNRIIINGAVEPGTKAMLYEISGSKVGEYPLENLNRNEIMVYGFSQRVYLLKIECKNFSQVLKLVTVYTNY